VPLSGARKSEAREIRERFGAKRQPLSTFNNIPPPPEFSATPFPIARPPIDDGKNAIVDLIDVGLILCVAVVAYLFCGIVVGIAYAVAHPGISSQELGKALSHNAWFVLSIELLVYVLVVGFMAFLVWARHKMPLGEAIRWNVPTGRRVVYALAGGLALAVFSDVAQVIFARWIPKSLPITEFFQDRSSAFLLAGFGILIAPLVEELLFRGFLYPALSRWTGVAPAVIVTAAAFALLHGSQLAYSAIPLLLIFVVGAALAITRALTKSVATSVLVHMSYNFTLFLQVYIGTQGFRKLS
jgi:CAAX protease family protein